MADITGAHHAAFTVTDVERSRVWYEDLLGMTTVMQVDDDEVSVRVLAHPASGLVIGLRQYHSHDDGAFSEFRTGLDHLALGVPTRADLEAWQAELEKRSVDFSPITETPIGTVIVFRDPDNIQLEFWLPMGS